MEGGDVLQCFSPVSFLGVLVFLLLMFHFFLSTTSKGHSLEPPGPKPIPIIGNLLQLDLKRPDKTFLELSKKYGPVFTVYMGPKKAVVLTGLKAVKEAFVGYADEFGDREAPTVAEEANLHYGIIWANGNSWKEMRRFALTNLKDFGMGKKVCEEKINEECRFLIEELKKFQGKPFDITQPISYAVSNIICSMVYGSRFEYNDSEFKTIVNRTSQSLHLLGTPVMQLYNLFPTIGKLVFFARKKMRDIFAANKRHHWMLLNRLKKTLNPAMCRGVADAFLVRQQQHQEAGITDSYYNDDNLLLTVMNLFAAGTETTSATLRWALVFMAKYPEIQNQVQEEIKRVIGDRLVQVEDRQNLPFTEAVIHETQRAANVIPVGLFRKTSKDIVFQGYSITKGTTVIPVLTSVLHDGSEWEKPTIFHPAHFLRKDGKFFKRDAFQPFSAGHRMCPGESLVRMELFIFFSTLLQHFRFSPAPGVTEEELDLSPHTGSTLSPQAHKLRAIPRL